MRKPSPFSAKVRPVHGLHVMIAPVVFVTQLAKQEDWIILDEAWRKL